MADGKQGDKTPQELGIRIVHVGINAASPEEAERTAALFCRMLGLPATSTPVSHMAFPNVEVMDHGGPGEHGHIGIHCDDIEAAEPFFEQLGFTVDDATRRRNPDGTTFLVYLKEPVCGFALHLTREG